MINTSRSAIRSSSLAKRNLPVRSCTSRPASCSRCTAKPSAASQASRSAGSAEAVVPYRRSEANSLPPRAAPASLSVRSVFAAARPAARAAGRAAWTAALDTQASSNETRLSCRTMAWTTASSDSSSVEAMRATAINAGSAAAEESRVVAWSSASIKAAAKSSVCVDSPDSQPSRMPSSAQAVATVRNTSSSLRISLITGGRIVSADKDSCLGDLLAACGIRRASSLKAAMRTEISKWPTYISATSSASNSSAAAAGSSP
mmetsp:Transcript_75710/g.133712  ORF Transcript_75710/g.133712 Transcript_75710/m.133712 type:complete len:260 (+) Transcript_75710:321-1100(+)